MLNNTFSSVFGGFILSAGAVLGVSGFYLQSQALSIPILWEFLLPEVFKVEMLLLVDSISVMFMATVFTVAGAVFLFSETYMSKEKFYLRFHLLVVAFIISMAFLIFSPNLISLLLGWDGLGVTSFLLVVYFQSAKSFNAGLLTVLTNRFGDLLILLAIAIAASEGDWNIFLKSTNSEWLSGATIIILIVVASFTKSAQIPFSAWLPAAMAAPTPVSSLVHSSTLVTAGVYLLIRLSDLMTIWAVDLLPFIFGTLTMFMAGASALYEPDMKKIVALSTLSQLGLMMGSLGLGAWELAFSHLIAHAFFKALLFMAVGNSIHMADDFQDMRKASLSVQSKMTLSFSGLANLSLCGFPFMAGFFSKDWILESGLFKGSSLVVILLFMLSTALTVAYSTRFMLMCWWACSRTSSFSWENDEDLLIVVSCMVLAPLAVAGGSLLIGHYQSIEVSSLSFFAKNITLQVIISGGLGVFLFWQLSDMTMKINMGAWSWGSMWSLPYISSIFLTKPKLSMAVNLRLFDLSWLPALTSQLTLGGSKLMASDFTLSYMKFLAMMGAAVLILSAFVIY